MKIVDSQQMAGIDAETQEHFGIPGILLMENAGIRAFEAFQTEAIPGKRLVFVAGGGNNGGDALVMARQAFFTNRYDVKVVLVKDECGEAVTLQRKIVSGLGIPVFSWPSDTLRCEAVLREADVVFDGMFGTGLGGPVRIPQYIDFLNALSCRRVAIDLPSGLRDGYKAGEPCVKADITLTIELPKLCLYHPAGRLCCGDIRVVPIGFPEALTSDPSIPGELLTTADIGGLLPVFPKDAYKNLRGHVAVFAGASGTTGAAILSSEAAARSMAGLVSLFIDRDAYLPVASQLSSVMVKPWDPQGPVSFDPSHFQAVLVGPGWGGKDREPWLSALITSPLPGVIDADGVSILKGMLPVQLGSRWILTPHVGEFARFLDIPKDQLLADPLTFALRSARETGAFIVLKSHVTYIASPDGRFAVYDGMNPAAGTGGSGDVLSGVIAGFLACGLSPWNAARLGVLVHGTACAQCFAEMGWFLAQDILPYLSRIGMYTSVGENDA